MTVNSGRIPALHSEKGPPSVFPTVAHPCGRPAICHLNEMDEVSRIARNSRVSDEFQGSSNTQGADILSGPYSTTVSVAVDHDDKLMETWCNAHCFGND